MDSQGQIDRRRRLAEFVAAIVTTFLLVGISRLETRLYVLSESLSESREFVTTIIYFALINLNVILILTLSFLIFRNVAKLVLERRRGVLGSKLRTKLVVSLVLFALAPTAVMFYISTRFITTSFEDWFSERVQFSMEQAREVGAKVYRQDGRRLESIARIAAQQVEIDSSEFDPWARVALRPVGLQGFESEYGLQGLAIFDGAGQVVWSSPNSLAKVYATSATLRLDQVATSFLLDSGKVSANTVVPYRERDVVLGMVPIRHPSFKERLLGYVVAEERFDTQILRSIEALLTDFSSLKPGAQLMRLSFTIVMVAMALLILFAACWLGFHVARGITGPIGALALAAKEIGQGNYTVKLQADADDETGQLVGGL